MMEAATAAEMQLATVQLDAELARCGDIARDENPYWVYLGSLAVGSRQTMVSSLATTAEFFGCETAANFAWHMLSFAHVAALRSWLAGRYAPATCNRWLCAVRGVLHAAWKLGRMSEENYRRACSVKRVKGHRLPPGRSLSSAEICSLFQSGDGSAISYRDAAVLACLYGGGLRRHEVCALDVGDFDAASATLRVMGKGNAERLAHLATGAPQLLSHWLHVRASRCDAAERDSGPLLLPMRDTLRFALRRLSVKSVYAAVGRARKRANVGHFTPHDMRRTFVSDLLETGADLSTVQKLVGHASPTTTAQYDRRDDEQRAKAARRLLVPFDGAES